MLRPSPNNNTLQLPNDDDAYVCVVFLIKGNFVI